MPTEWDPLGDMPNLHGKVAVVTGGNTGIGLATVKFLALRGAKVYVAARSEDKAKKAIQSLVTAHLEIDQAQLSWLPLDLSDLKSVVRAADYLKGEETKLDLLINNAGMATGSVETLGDGWEMTMAINHVGHFVLTNGVLPLLKAAVAQKDADVRVVTVTSSAMYAMLPPNYEFNFTSSSFLQKPTKNHPWQWRYLQSHIFHVDMIRYSVSKAANAMFAQELQRIFDEQRLPILSISVHPGGVATDGVMTIGTGLFRALVKSAFITTDQGAITSVFAATATEVRKNPSKYGGKYLEPYGKIAAPHQILKNQAAVKGMWDNTTTGVNSYFKKQGLPILQSW
ncbi:daunorubicin C-13 ketoreductase [Thelonectria olida]|uniref:Daunorubicin C-13 ketoreductase n=1 Tax=Thelonectria olida TaxID=1576542 RepID=A0A9P8W3T8_9HYPO|nr:daunorubicin C-13 ketoreductase [Thelonectria olida]